MFAFYSALLPRFGTQFCLLLTWALAHFLWQGCLLAVAFAVARRVLARQSANARYAAALITLLLMAACLPGNLLLVDPAATNRPLIAAEQPAISAKPLGPDEAAQVDRAAGIGSNDRRQSSDAASNDRRTAVADGSWRAAARWVDAALASVSSYAAAAYGLGLALMLARVFFGLSIGRRLRRASIPIRDAATLDLMRRHAARLALRAAPAVAWCSRISVPVAVGVLRPMILLPTSLATGLTGRQLEYVLLHELAHIQRYDLIANLLQRLIEVILFFHPAVWWLTRQVRIERENACDDAVLHAGCQRAAYAESLLRVAELCAFAARPTASLAGLLAATGENPSQLARRIHRLFNVDPPARSAAPTALTLAIFGVFAVVVLVAPRDPATAQISAAGSSADPADPRDVEPSGEQNITEIRIAGNETRATEQILNAIDTRVDRPLDRATLEKDVRTPACQKLVDKREAHFQLRKGRIAYVPFTEFASKVRSLLEATAPKLGDADEITETYGPLSDFTIRYTLARVDLPWEETVRSGHGGSYIHLAAFIFYPVSGDIGEPVADAMTKASFFRRKLEECNPKHYTITFWIYPDSIDDFNRVRKELHELGYAVVTHLMPENRRIGGPPRGTKSSAQAPAPGPDRGADARRGDAPIDPLAGQTLVEIRIAGNEAHATEQILNAIATRVDRPLDQATLEKDVRTLAAKKWFRDVRPIVEPVDGGVRLTLEVVERPTLLYVKYLGNTKIRDKRLAKETELRRGSPVDLAAIEEGRRKVEEFYESKGYNDARVVILEGTRPGDRGAIYMIDEGDLQKTDKPQFHGNTITSGQRLKTEIQAKPPILGLFEGEQDEEAISADIDKLIAYYRGLGFFRVRVSRQIVMDDQSQRPATTFVVDEGPRFRIAGIRFVGSQKFTDEQLSDALELKAGEFYAAGDLDPGLRRVRDMYRAEGYRFAAIQPQFEFDDEASMLTVIVSIKEVDYFGHRFGRAQ